MRLDIFLKKVLLFKKRSEAKRMCDHSLIKLNGQDAKPSKQINPGDTIAIETMKGIQNYRVIDLPLGNVRKDETNNYYEEIA